MALTLQKWGINMTRRMAQYIRWIYFNLYQEHMQRSLMVME